MSTYLPQSIQPHPNGPALQKAVTKIIKNRDDIPITNFNLTQDGDGEKSYFFLEADMRMQLSSVEAEQILEAIYGVPVKVHE